MELSEKVALARRGISEVETADLVPVLGNPVAPGLGDDLPEGLRALYEVFDGLSAELVVITPCAKVAAAFADMQEDSELFNPAPNKVAFGSVAHSSNLCIDRSDGSVYLLTESKYMEALESFELMDLEPIAPAPVAFAEDFLFGPRYPELVELAGGYLNPGARERDGWRRVLGSLGFL